MSFDIAMTEEEESFYRLQAAEAERHARRASEHHRAFWLRLAQSWLDLIRRQTPDDTQTAN